jgi:DNA-binding beta-propeller fold protein YncE
VLKPLGFVDLPRHASGGFDHGDVHLPSGKVFVAHTANNSIEVVDGENQRHLETIPGCPEASGVLCAPGEDLVIAAARGAGKILLIDASKDSMRGETQAGRMPNGLAWDGRRKHILVADVGDNSARILDASSKRLLSTIGLPGRPRWSVYDDRSDVFLVNVREPSGVFLVSAESMEGRFVPVSVAGAHGLDLERNSGRAYIACDGRAVVVLDVATGKEITTIPISGEPDAIWHNPKSNLLYCAIGKPGVVEVIDTAKLAVIERIETEEGAHTLAFDKARQRLYVFLPRSCRVSIYQER